MFGWKCEVRVSVGNTKIINVLSLCTGYGGIELALSASLEAVFRVVAVEIEAYALANLVAKAEQGKLAIEALFTDVKTFPRERFSGCFDILTAGYPCQPFSNAGRRLGTKDPQHLWPYIREHIRTIKPAMVLLENVSGHVSLGFKEVVFSLQRMGYTTEAGLFTAAEVGAPHKRERVFILGYSKEFRLERFRPQGREQVEFDRAGEKLAHAESERALREPSEFQQENGRSGRTLLRQPVITDKGTGNPDSQHGRSHAGGRLDKAETRSASEELVNTEHNGHTRPEVGKGNTERGNGNEARQNSSCKSTGPSSKQLVDAESSERGRLSEKYTGRGTPKAGRSNGVWPARPGQEQYEWEEPRTVEPGMGRTVDGTACRVDELRLLGNGVLWQQAQKAIRELFG